MDVIISYLDNLFLTMPKTPEVQRAREELSSMMEDKYNELIAEGRKENEAIGIVISEFGDISELMEGFGCESTESGSTVNGAGAAVNGIDMAAANGAGAAAEERKPIHVMSRAEAEEYMETAKRSGKWTAAGTALCILCAVPLLICGGFEDSVNGFSTWIDVEAAVVLFGVTPLFLLIGIGIACFIHSNMMMHHFEYVDNEQIKLDASYEKELRVKADNERHKSEKMRIVSVFLFVLCLIPLFISGAISDNDIVNAAALCLTLALVAAGVVLNIVRRSRRNCIDVLLGEASCEEEEKKEYGPVGKVLDAILSAYWYIITAVYLGWSCLTRDWGFTWIVWVIAWPLYAAIGAVLRAVDGE